MAWPVFVRLNRGLFIVHVTMYVYQKAETKSINVISHGSSCKLWLPQSPIQMVIEIPELFASFIDMLWSIPAICNGEHNIQWTGTVPSIL